MTPSPKTLPFDKTAEQFVLGAMLNSINAVNHCIPQLNKEDFYISENQAVLGAIRALYEAGHAVNALNAAQELKANKAAPWEYVVSLELNASSIDYEYYLLEVIKVSKLRKIILAAQEALLSSGKDCADPQEIISKLQNSLFQAQGIGVEETKTPAAILENYCNGRSFQEHTLWAFDEVRAGRLPYPGVASGYPLLDKTLGYFRPGCYYTIGARTSMGKTTLLLNLMRLMNTGGRETPIGFFSLEMSADIISTKLICLFAGVKYSDYDDAKCSLEELESILSWQDAFKKMPLFIEDQTGLKISQVKARAKRMLQNHNIKILFIDYLTLIKPDNKHNSNHLAVNEISKGIQHLAKELKIPIVVLAQLNRQVTGRANNKPNIADFRESGSIEEDSDVCMLLHRPEYYDAYNRPGIVELYVAKNRLRGELKKVEFNVPYGEVYCELDSVESLFNETNTE